MTNGETQTVNFGDVTFKAEGTYKFNIQETSEAPSGWTYDKSAHEVTVTVTKDPSAGKLIAKVAGNNPTIENSYATEDVTLTGDTALYTGSCGCRHKGCGWKRYRSGWYNC